MKPSSQTLLYIIFVALTVAVKYKSILSYQVEFAFWYLQGAGGGNAAWWSQLLSCCEWMSCTVARLPPHPSGTLCMHSEACRKQTDWPKWNHDRTINVQLITIEFIMLEFYHLQWNPLKLLICSLCGREKYFTFVAANFQKHWRELL